MYSILKKTIAPLVSLFIFVIGSGLFTTLLAIRLHEAHVRPIIIGAMTAAYYLGFMLGSFRIERFIIRVGHIRAFAAFSSALAVISLLHGIFVIPWVWLILRLLGGFATAGLIIVIESWLLIAGTIRTRGQVLALYMVTFYAAQSLGQFLINIGNPESLLLYAITAMTASLAVIPLAMTRSRSPEFDEPSTLSLKKLYKASPTGILGSICAGLILGAIYGLMPIYFVQLTGKTSEVSLFMAIIIFGGMVLQYPIGKISDYIDRRSVLIVVCLMLSCISLFTFFSNQNRLLLIIGTFLLGGLSFTIYPISISHTCDSLDSKDIVAGTQSLVLTYSIGACLGPLLAPIFMHSFTHNGIFVYYLTINVFLVVFFLWRKLRQPPAPDEDQENFVSVPHTTPVAAELDPRSEG